MKQILPLLSVLLLYVPLQAQWKVISHLPPIRTVYFLDEVGTPDVGFCGGSFLFRSTDRGQTWTKVLTPESGSLTDVSFSDPYHGWVTYTNGFVYYTEDGGIVWNQVEALPEARYTAVKALTRERIYISNWSDKALFTTNAGMSWSQFAQRGQNGYAFADSLHGIVSPVEGYLYRTSNGGSSWIRITKETRHTWQPHAIKNTSIFFGASEGTDEVYRSDDYGQTWKTISTPPFQLAGQIAGSINRLYMAAMHGFYRSLDTGKTWQMICGPSGGMDRRFHVSGDSIFAGDGNTGELWLNPTGTETARILSLTPDKFSFSRSVCDTPMVISGDIEYSTTCDVGDSMKASLRLSDGTYVAFPPSSTPGAIHKFTASLPGYRPSGVYTGTVEITINGPVNRIDTTIPFHLTVESVLLDSIFPTQLNRVLRQCVTLNDSISVRSKCESFELLDVQLLDKGLIDLVVPQTLPMTIGPTDAFTVYLRETPSTPMEVSTRLKLTVKKNNVVEYREVPINIVRLGKGGELYGGKSTITAASDCGMFDSLLQLQNRSCDTMVVISVESSNPLFTIANAAAFPFACPPDSFFFAQLLANLQNNNIYALPLRIVYVLNGKQIDTTILYDINATWKEDTRLVLSNSVVSFPFTPSCITHFLSLGFFSRACSAFVLDSIILEQDIDSAFSITTLPTGTIPPDSTLIIALQFRPELPIMYEGQLHLYYSKGDVAFDTIIALTGIGEEGLSPKLSNDSIVFPPQAVCTKTVQHATLQNLSCDTIVITVLHGFTRADFSLESPLPVTLGTQDSIGIPLVFAPQNSSTSNDSLVLVVETDKSLDTLIIYVSGSGQGDSVRLGTLLAVNFDSTDYCVQQDTIIDVVNLSLCDTLEISDISYTGDNDFTVGPLQLPYFLPPGNRLPVTVHFQPLSQGYRAGALVIRSKTGVSQEEDTTHIAAFVTPEREILISIPVIDYGAISYCTDRDTIISLSNPGCTDIIVTGFGITGTGFIVSSEFPLLIPVGESRNITITSNIDTAGGKSVSTAVVSFHSATATSLATIQLHRSYLHPRVYNLTLSTTEPVSAGGVVQLKLGIQGDIVDLRTIDFRLAYNADLLEYQQSTGDNLVTNNNSVFTIQGNPEVAVGSDGSIAILEFLVHLTSETTSKLRIHDPQLNKSTPAYQQCFALASIDSSNFNYYFQCGDRFLYDHLNGKTITLDGIIPNPTNGNIRISFTTPVEMSIQLELTDQLGRPLAKRTILGHPGNNNQEIDLSSYGAGIYSLRLISVFGRTSAMFIKQ